MKRDSPWFLGLAAMIVLYAAGMACGETTILDVGGWRAAAPSSPDT